MSKEWFILQFKANSYNRATKNLNQQGFQTFLPLQNITSRKASRFINTSRPLFPGYMFITFDRTTTEWQKINYTYGVSHLVTFNSLLKPISSIFIDNLMKRFDLSGKLLPIKKLNKGTQVEILNGPFANFIANIEKYETNHRVSILIDLMGRKTKLQAPPEDLLLSN
jgi:transcriptional antiterminator RfaH